MFSEWFEGALCVLDLAKCIVVTCRFIAALGRILCWFVITRGGLLPLVSLDKFGLDSKDDFVHTICYSILVFFNCK